MRMDCVSMSFSTRRSAVVAAFLLAIALVAVNDAAPPAEGVPVDDVHRALGILNYVVGDYPLAVSDEGAILNNFEYREQITLLERVREILIRVAPLSEDSDAARALVTEVDALRRLVEEASGPRPVLLCARRLRDALIAHYDLQLTPLAPPSLARGRELYLSACAICHGSVGRARTPLAERLEPRPTDLLSRHLDQTLSPYQAFNVVTYGVDGTSMPAFEPLSAAERWDVAFYVAAMRQRAVPRKSAQRIDPPLHVLARSTDADLARWLAEQGVPAARCASEVARLRRQPTVEGGD